MMSDRHPGADADLAGHFGGADRGGLASSCKGFAVVPLNEGRHASDLLTNFQEMRHEGDISDADYRKIKSVLGEQLQRELKDGKDKG